MEENSNLKVGFALKRIKKSDIDEFMLSKRR